MSHREPVADVESTGFLTKYFFVLRDQRGSLGSIVALFLALSLLDLLGVGLIGPFIGAVINPAGLDRFAVLRELLAALGGGAGQQRIAVLGGVLAVVFVVKGVLAYGVQRRILSFSFSFRTYLIKKLMDAYLRMPYQFYLERNSSTVVQSVINHTKVMSDDMLIPSLRLVSDALMLFVLGLFLCWVNLVAVLLLGAMLGGAFLLYARLVRPHVRQAGQDVATTNEQIIRGVNQGIGGIKEIRTLRVEAPFFANVAAAADVHSSAQLRFNASLAVPRYLMETVLVLFVILFSLYVVFYGGNGAQLIPVLAMFGAAGMRVLPAVTQVSASLASMNYSSFALVELYRDLRYVEAHGIGQSPEHVISGGDEAPSSFETFALDGIRYSYPNTGRAAIDGLSLTVRKGQSIGFIGESGAGKTTLVDILLGLHSFDEGSFTVDGVDIGEYGWSRWLGQVAYIPQNVFLIDDTLERNVAFGIPDGDVDHERVAAALAAAQLSDLVARLPEGTKTVLGERGIRLSGGERQRIALARAFYYNRNIFILDEATSALDVETERQIIEVIEKLHGVKTLIVIAHRLTTLKGCDVIFRLQGGKIAASGNYHEVVGGVEDTCH